MTLLEWTNAADHDANQAESGVHHEQPAGTDWAAADVIEKGYPAVDTDLDVHLPLEEDSGTTVNDVSGNGNDFAATGATANQSGILGRSAWEFDGVDDHISLDPYTSLPTDAWSFVCWAYDDSGLSNDRFYGVFNQTNIGGGNTEKNGILGDGGDFYAGVEDSGGTFVGSGDIARPTNEWVLLAAVFDTANIEIWMYDSSKTLSTSSAAVGSACDNHATIELGRTVGTSYFGGRIASAQLYHRAITQTFFEELFDAVGGTSTHTTSAKVS